MIKRTNEKALVVHKDEDFEAFVRIMGEACIRVPMHVVGRCLKPNISIWCSGPRLSSLCSFRTLYFTPESGPATEGFSCRGAVMNDEGNAARKIRKLRASRDLWKQHSAEKQQEIRQLRVTVRDLSSSRENWKTRVKELEQQLQAAHEAHAAVGPGSWIFFGGLMDNQAMPRTRRTPITLSSD